jgi:acetyl-CoA acetyltransferase
MSKQIQEAYIVAAVRTPVGKAPRGMFKNVRPDDMLAHVLRGAIAKVPGLDPHDIGDVIVGCAMPEGEQGMNVARIGVLLAGLPDSVPAVTINRFCSSGVQAVSMAADRIRTGDDDVVIAGTLSGSPASNTPMRATFMPCSPSGMAQPTITSPMSCASSPGTCAMAPFSTCASMSSGRTFLNMPRGALPTGVRTAASRLTARPITSLMRSCTPRRSLSHR